jgi:glutamate-1-semialdehyde aminotransferase
MPALGQGSSGIRTAILTEAALQNQKEGKTNVEGATDLVSNKASTTAIAQLQKQKTMVGAFERTATKNADIASKLSEQTDRTGIPVFNSWLQAGQKGITGNPTVSAFNAANETFVNEYAKIMSGSMGNTPVSDAARAHAHDMLSNSQTKEQYQAVLNVLRQEMGNRMSGFDEELMSAKEGLKGTPKKAEAPKMSVEDQQALNWANNNSNDPRAKQIKQKLGL